MRKILVIRADRIGDVVLSTPVLKEIKRAWPNSHLTFLVRPLVAPLLEKLSLIDELLIYDPVNDYSGWTGEYRLVQALAARKFDAAIMLQYQPKLAFALLAAGIPVRVGPYSKLGSYFAFNKGQRQRRSRVEKHEAEYNLDLLKPLGLTPQERVEPVIAIDDRARALVRNWWAADASADRPKIAIHPGMGGSALNWPLASYQDLARRLMLEGVAVAITLGPMDQAIRSGFVGKGARLFDGSLSELAALYESCAGIIAPSTGPLHVAAATGRWVIGLYPNIRVQSPKRWSPYAQDPARVRIFTPPIDCGKDPDCMSKISVKEVHEEVKRRLTLRSSD